MTQAVIPALMVRLEEEMSCKRCASTDLQDFEGELTASFLGIRALNLSPVYVCQSICVCLVCGYTELLIPAPELERLRKGTKACHSQVA